MFAFSGSMYLIGLLVPETYAPKLLRQRAQALSKQTGGHYISMLDLHLDPNATYLNKVKGNLTQPFILLFTEITVFLFSLYAALICKFAAQAPNWLPPSFLHGRLPLTSTTDGVLFLLFGGVPLTFQVARGWGSGVGSLRELDVALPSIPAELADSPTSRPPLRPPLFILTLPSAFLYANRFFLSSSWRRADFRRLTARSALG